MSTEPSSRPWFYWVVYYPILWSVTVVFWGSYGAVLGGLFSFTRPGGALDSWAQSVGAGSLMEVAACLAVFARIVGVLDEERK